MSTWQISSGDGDALRWETSHGELVPVPGSDCAFAPRLPSMAELLRQGCLELQEQNVEDFEGTPTFGAGFARSIPFEQSPIANFQVRARCHFSDTLFQTGSGKTVNVSSKGLARAKALLGLHDDGNQCDSQGAHDTTEFRGVNSSLRHEETNEGAYHRGVVDGASIPRSLYTCSNDSDKKRLETEATPNMMQSRLFDSTKPPQVKFHTAGGRSISVSSDALRRAKNLLSDPELGSPVDEADAGDTCSNNSDKKRLKTQATPNMMHSRLFDSTKPPQVKFHATGGRSISVSSDALRRAKSLLSDPELGSSVDEADAGDTCSNDSNKKRLETEATPNMMQSRLFDSTKPPQVKFHTAGGRSISVSSDALRRAKSLFSDPELGSSVDEVEAGDMDFWLLKLDASSNTGNDPLTSLPVHDITPSSLACKTFVSPLRSTYKLTGTSESLKSLHSGTNLMSQFDAVSQDNRKLRQQSASNQQVTLNTFVDESSENGTALRKNLGGRKIGRQLADISNTHSIGTVSTNNNKQLKPEKRRIFGNSVSPFKRPRTSKFSTPMKDNVSLPRNGLSNLSFESSRAKERVSFLYPDQGRVYIREYFGSPPTEKNALRWTSPDNAEKFMFPDGLDAEAFFHMLTGAGASSQYASKEWVKNHYKWIVWKLASYERYYPTKCSGNMLTVSNVLDELKYRYEREVNRAHRSAIKRILEGDASPTSPMVLCISAVCSNQNHTNKEQEDSINHAAKVEVTDGWYSVNAALDANLLKRLALGKLFVGQKLRIWGAGLSGWVGPVSPLEVSSTASLVLHINGTYRTHWGDRLGFCKGAGIPLAFKCIDSNGGRVPLTLVGILRVYPVLYKERLNDGKAVVRSERMESKAVQSYQRRCSAVVEGIASNYHRDPRPDHDSDGEEGAEILKILENCAEPDVELAGMSPAQISSFAKYQAKMEAIRQSDMEKSIEKALENSGLGKRDVSPFMRVRVVGLRSKSNQGNEIPKEGMVTIWHPSEKQQNELVEGKAYTVAGLLPNNAGTDTGITFLQARDFTTWKPLSLQAVQQFKPFFKPRKAANLSKFGEIPLSSEFDIAALVIFVGHVRKTDHQTTQWVFVADSSVSALRSRDLFDCLLAIRFCSSYINDDSFVPFNSNLEGSTVGFNNLVKNPKDEANRLWVAEASQNSTYSGSFNTANCSHLKEAAKSTEQWRKRFHLTIDKLREKVLYIVGQN